MSCAFQPGPSVPHATREKARRSFQEVLHCNLYTNRRSTISRSRFQVHRLRPLLQRAGGGGPPSAERRCASCYRTLFSGVILFSPGYRAPECRTWNKWKDLQSHKRRRKLQGSFSNLGNNGSRSDKNSTFHISCIIFLLDTTLGQNKIVKNVILIIQYE